MNCAVWGLSRRPRLSVDACRASPAGSTATHVRVQRRACTLAALRPLIGRTHRIRHFTCLRGGLTGWQGHGVHACPLAPDVRHRLLLGRRLALACRPSRELMEHALPPAAVSA